MSKSHWRETQKEELVKKFSQKIKPLTKGQSEYFKLIEEKIITICMGPAGSGKSYIPTNIGLNLLLDGKIDKLILTRPLVTCSSSNKDALGILPGEIKEKIGPYLRPLLDVIEEKISKNDIDKLIETKKIDLIPLDVMRGLSFKNSLIIADEMQNASYEAIKMILTRFGMNCKLILSGDPSQSDLYNGECPLVTTYHKLNGHKDIGRIILTHKDVVRHPLISWIDRRLSEVYDGDRIEDKKGQIWYKDICPFCETPNWTCNGDEHDITSPDVSTIKCWQCGEIMELDEEGYPTKPENKLKWSDIVGVRVAPVGCYEEY